jgi:hypothetical protein
MAKADSLLPEDTDNSAIDAEDLRVNFSDDEAKSEGRGYDPIPTGKYPARIVKVDLEKCSPKSKNPGKPMWNVQMIIQNEDNDDHKYHGRYLFARVMLFDGALYTLAQIDKALAPYGEPWGAVTKTGVIPNQSELLDKMVTVSVVKQVDKYKIEEGEWDPNSGDPKPQKNEVKGFMPYAAAAAGVGGGNTLMP